MYLPLPLPPQPRTAPPSPAQPQKSISTKKPEDLEENNRGKDPSSSWIFSGRPSQMRLCPTLEKEDVFIENIEEVGTGSMLITILKYLDFISKSLLDET